MYNDRFLMHYVISGKGKFMCENKIYNLSAGNAFLIGNKKGYYEADENEPWHYAWINFGGDIAMDFLKKTGLSVENPIYTSRKPDITGESFLQMADNVYEQNKFLMYANIFSTLGKMIEYNANPVKYETREMAEYINICKQYIKANYFKPISIKQLCEITGVERSYLFRLFKKYTNSSPTEYIIRYKMKKASDILENNDISVAEAALLVGYSDQFAFSKIFKKHYKMSPNMYKKICESSGKRPIIID